MRRYTKSNRPSREQSEFIDSEYSDLHSKIFFIEITKSASPECEAFKDYAEILANHSEGNIYNTNPKSLYNKRAFVMYDEKEGITAVGIIIITLSNWIDKKVWMFETSTVVHADHRGKGHALTMHRFVYRLMYERGFRDIYMTTKEGSTAHRIAERDSYKFLKRVNTEIVLVKKITREDFQDQ